jgi:hypothetical protein
MKRKIHENGGALAINFTLDLNRLSSSKEIILNADIFVDEAGFTNGCRGASSGARWREKMELLSALAKREAYISINRVCIDTAELTTSDISWIVANFLLVRGARSYVAIVENNKYGRYVDVKPLSASVGIPIGPSYQIGSLSARRYERGIVVVNPTLESVAARLQGVPRSLQGMLIEVRPLSGIIKYY